MKIIALALLLFPLVGLSWDGVDTKRGTAVEIEKGNTVKQGAEIEYLDSNGQYRYGDVESVNRHGNTVEIEVRDQTTGEIRTFDMDDQ